MTKKTKDSLGDKIGVSILVGFIILGVIFFLFWIVPSVWGWIQPENKGVRIDVINSDKMRVVDNEDEFILYYIEGKDISYIDNSRD